MTWFKVDDTLGSHPKARAAGLAAMGLWVVAGAWSSQHLTEGFVPHWYVNSWPSGQKRAANLVQSGLWIEVDSGFSFHQWEERNPSKEQVESERAAARERQRKHRESKRDAVVSHAVTNAVTNRTPTRPDPTIVPSGTIGGAKRATQRPADWKPNQKHHDMAAQLELHLDRELEQFTDYHDAKGSAFKDWDASFRTWLRNAAKWGKSRRNPYGKQQETDDLFDAAYQRALIADQNQQELSS